MKPSELAEFVWDLMSAEEAARFTTAARAEQHAIVCAAIDRRSADLKANVAQMDDLAWMNVVRPVSLKQIQRRSIDAAHCEAA